MASGQAAGRAAPLRIRPAGRADLNDLVDLEQRCFASDRMSRRSYSAALTSRRAVILAIPGPTGLLGAVAVFFRADSPAARLYSIATAPEARGRGLGARLLRAAERAAASRGARALRLEVSASNKSALALYRKSGYGVIGHVAGYYEDGSDAWRLEKNLPIPSPAGNGQTRFRGT